MKIASFLFLTVAIIKFKYSDLKHLPMHCKNASNLLVSPTHVHIDKKNYDLLLHCNHKNSDGTRFVNVQFKTLLYLSV